MPSPAPELMDDLLAEIFLRLPPDEHASLVRASLVCKPWRSLISNPAFLRPYSASHRASPMLGFVLNSIHPSLARFVPRPSVHDRRVGRVLDCRHGRTLLYDSRSSEDLLLVCDPVTGEMKHLRVPADVRPQIPFSGAVLCATAGCRDHLDCNGGSFLVAFVCNGNRSVSGHAYLYSSETAAWSLPTSLQFLFSLRTEPPVLVGNALYFMCTQQSMSILRYEFGGDRGLLVFGGPPEWDGNGKTLIQAEDGGLGFAILDRFTVRLWSLETVQPDGVARWEPRRVIELEMIRKTLASSSFPYLIPYLIPPYLVGFAQGPDSCNVLIRTYTDNQVYMVELKSERLTKVSERDYPIFPYMNFCTPVRLRGVTAGEQGVAAANNMASISVKDGVLALHLEAP